MYALADVYALVDGLHMAPTGANLNILPSGGVEPSNALAWLDAGARHELAHAHSELHACTSRAASALSRGAYACLTRIYALIILSPFGARNEQA